MIRKPIAPMYDDEKISRVDFSKHPHAISLRRIIVGVLVGLVAVVAFTVIFV